MIDPAVAPTCTESGLTEGKHCSVCNTVFIAQNVIPAKGHTEVIDPAVAPTCTTSGKTEGKHCSECGETFVAQTVIPAKGHIWDNDTCSVCGLQLTKCNSDYGYTLLGTQPKAKASALQTFY